MCVRDADRETLRQGDRDRELERGEEGEKEMEKWLI